jgi:RimJ/RimL family protein N-acetyltransferase
MGNTASVMDERDVVVEGLCRERDGEVVRRVRRTKLSIDRLKFIWDKLHKFDVLFNDWVRGDFEAFLNHFIVQIDGELHAAGLMWDVDDVGMFMLTDIVPGICGTAHFTFWDRRFRGREELCRAMLRHVFDTYGFKRIEVRVPLYAHSARAATERIGFVLEGRLRSVALYKDRWFDVNVYSMLNDDVIPGGDLSTWRNRRSVCRECGKVFRGSEN